MTNPNESVAVSSATMFVGAAILIAGVFVSEDLNDDAIAIMFSFPIMLVSLAQWLRAVLSLRRSARAESRSGNTVQAVA